MLSAPLVYLISRICAFSSSMKPIRNRPFWFIIFTVLFSFCSGQDRKSWNSHGKLVHPHGLHLSWKRGSTKIRSIFTKSSEPHQWPNPWVLCPLISQPVLANTLFSLGFHSFFSSQDNSLVSYLSRLSLQPSQGIYPHQLHTFCVCTTQSVGLTWSPDPFLPSLAWRFG